MSNRDAIFDVINQTYNRQPDAESLDLTDYEIEDLDGILEVLEQFQELVELNLQNNKFRALPEDLSGFLALQTINLNNIDFDNFENTAASLGTIPNLKNLYINLTEEDEVGIIMQMIPGLEMLNDLPVDRDALNETGQSQEVESAVQAEAYRNSAEKVDELPEEDEEQSEMYNSEAEISDRMEVIDGEEGDGLAVEEDRLDETNDSVAIYRSRRRGSVIGNNLDTEELEAIALCFDQIREMRAAHPEMQDVNNDQMLGDQFDESLKQMMEKLQRDLLAVNSESDLMNVGSTSGALKGLAVISAKRDLMNLLVEKSIEYLGITDPNAEPVFGEIVTQYDTMIDQGLSLIKDLADQKKAATQSSAGGSNSVMKSQLRDKDKEIKQLTAQLQKAKDQEKKKASEAEILKRKVKDLEADNRSLRTRLSQTTKNNVSEKKAAPSSRSNTATPARNRTTSSYSNVGGPIGRTQTRVLTRKQLKDTIVDMYAQKVKFDKKCQDSRVSRETMEQFMYTYLNQKYGLKSLIVEWAASIVNGVKTYIKEEHDVALFAKIIKNECDEEFRFIQSHVKETLLNLVKVMIKDRYQHKSEKDVKQMLEQIQNGKIEDWMYVKILEKMYEEADAEILFQKIKEAIDERNLKVQQTGAQVNNFMSTASKESTLRSALNNTGVVGGASSAASTQGGRLTRQELQSHLQTTSKQRGQLLYADFQKVILDFQLREHERFLEKFTRMFKAIDTDADGVIDENEFRNLIQSMSVLHREEEIEYLLQVIDPFNNKKMTYSEVVHLLSSHMVPRFEDSPQQTIPLLEKFANTGAGEDDNSHLQVTDQISGFDAEQPMLRQEMDHEFQRDDQHPTEEEEDFQQQTNDARQEYADEHAYENPAASYDQQTNQSSIQDPVSDVQYSGPGAGNDYPLGEQN